MKDRKLINIYGLTETWDALAEEINICRYSVANLGKPLPNTSIFVLDENLKPVLHGFVGELCISGKSIAMGYWKQPDLTKQKFTTITIDNVQYSIFRTGDLVKLHSDNTIEYQSRVDRAVKVRGFRIEPAEIEAALLLHSDIKNAVVISNNNSNLLLAFVSLRENSEISLFSREKLVFTLRSFLSNLIPTSIIPDLFINIVIPLLPSGKVDLVSLNNYSIDINNNKSNLSSILLTETEERVWKIITNIINIDIDIHSNLFTVGLSSIQAIQLWNSIKIEFNIEITITKLLINPTINGVANLIDNLINNKNNKNNNNDNNNNNNINQCLVPLQPITDETTKKPLFCFPVAFGYSLGYLQFSQLLGKDQPFYAFDSNLNMPNSIEETATFYIKQIKTIQPHGPYHLVGWSFGGLIAYEVAHQLIELNENVKSIILIDTWATISNRPYADVDINIISLKLLNSMRAFNNLPSVDFDKKSQLIDELTNTLNSLNFNINISESLEIYIRNISMANKYTMKPLPLQPINVLLIRAQDEIEHDDYFDQWKSLLNNVLSNTITTPGNHQNILLKPYVHNVTTIVSHELNKLL